MSFASTEERIPTDRGRPPGDRRALALGASLLLGPGAGHLLRGRPRRGAAWLALVLLSLLLLPALGLRALLLTLALHLAAAVDAAVVAPAPRGLPGWGRTLRFLAGFAAVAALALVGLKTFVVDTFRVPGPSMAPALAVGDVFIVNKLTPARQPGDVIVYRSPGQGGRLFVHRIVAVGGDTVQVDGNVVYVNKVALPKRSLPGPCHYLEDHGEAKGAARWQELPCQTYEETAGGRTYPIIHGQAPGQLADVAPSKVPADGYYVLGDNRDLSNDSRAWGPVHAGDVIGRVASIAWSRGRDGVRWERLGRPLR
jgi:signal peptidase I